MLTHIGTITIETEQLTLHRFAYTDVDAMLQYWIADEKIQSMYSEPVYTTKEAVMELLDKYMGSYEEDYTFPSCETSLYNCIHFLLTFISHRTIMKSYFLGGQWYED